MAPLIDLWLYLKHFTIFTCARPVSVSFLYKEEPPLPISTPWGAYKWPSSCTQHVNLGKQHIVSACTFLVEATWQKQKGGSPQQKFLFLPSKLFLSCCFCHFVFTMFLSFLRTNIYPSPYFPQNNHIAVADPGFPIGGANLVGGCQLPRQLRSKKFVCQSERIWTLRGGARRQRPPESANA